MLSLQDAIRLSVDNGLIWSEMATRLMAAQAEMIDLIRQRNAIGGIEASLAFAARLRPSHRPELRRRIAAVKEKAAREKPGRSRALSI